jgi:hypothetical protein
MNDRVNPRATAAKSIAKRTPIKDWGGFNRGRSPQKCILVIVALAACSLNHARAATAPKFVLIIGR